MLWLISWVVAGLIVGGLARLVMPGPQPMGLFLTMVLGILGAFVGGAASYAIWGPPTDPMASNAWPGYFLAVLGAVVILAMGFFASRRRAIP